MLKYFSYARNNRIYATLNIANQKSGIKAKQIIEF